MKNLLVAIIFCGCWSSLIAQNNEASITQLEAESHLRFLASDELQGRETGTIGNLVAARYIAEQLRSYGVSAPDAIPDYYQNIAFEKVYKANSGALRLEDTTLIHGKNALITFGQTDTIDSELVFVGHALMNDTVNEFEGIDVAGKIVLAYLGAPGVNDPQGAFLMSRAKRNLVDSLGGLGLVEIFSIKYPFNFFVNYLNTDRIARYDDKRGDNSFYYALADYTFPSLTSDSSEMKSCPIELEFDTKTREKVNSPNVIGFIKGSDPDLADEYVLLSAHFDHVGMRVTEANPATLQDSIFNGARDNAVGITSLLLTAKRFAAVPPKRSIIFAAFTAEEIGLLGSAYYADNPVFPLDKTIFNLNSDGAGYNDTSIVSVFGLSRVGVENEIVQACNMYGLDVYGDPAPEQNLFDRSDNVSLAKKGVPAPTFSMGFKEFDNEIFKHYHQPSDEVKSLNMNYLMAFFKAYTLTARLIADKSEKPFWIADDKYEQVGKELYGIE